MTQTSGDMWGIWRARDRRGRMIGQVPGRDVDLLRLKGDLSRLGASEPEILIWTGAPAATQTVSRPALGKDAASRLPAQTTLIEHILLTDPDPHFRARLRTALTAYRDDVEAAARRGQSVTMNWDRLGSGANAKHMATRPNGPLPGGFRPVRRRLQALANALSPEDLEALHTLVIDEATRAKLSASMGIGVRLVEPKARSLLRMLMTIYGA